MTIQQAQLGLDRPATDVVQVHDASTVTLRPYQNEAIDAVLNEYGVVADGTQITRSMVVMPTGSGKTILAAALVREVKARWGVGRVLFLAHREELIFQTVEKMKLVLGRTVDIGIVKAELNQPGADIVVASIQTVQNMKRLSQLGRFDFVIADEAHHATAESWMKVLGAVGVFEADGPRLFGMTATPDRTDGSGLIAVFQTIAYEVGIFDMIDQGYLVDITAKAVQIDADFGRIRVTRGEYNAGDAGRELMRSQAPAVIAQAYVEHARDRQAIVFTPTVEVAHATAAAMQQLGVETKALDAQTPSDERKAIIAGMHDGTLQAVVNVGVLTEGTDIPSVSCIVMAQPTRSRLRYTQAIGRGLRTHIGKEDCLILDLVGVVEEHRLQTVPTLFGIEPKRLATKSVRQAKQEQEAEQLAFAGKVVVRDIAELAGRRMHWTATAEGQYLLAAPPDMVILRFAGTSLYGEPNWEVWHIEPGASPVRRYYGLPLDYAQGVAEDMARKIAGDTNPLMNPKARWRSDPPSEKQLSALKSMGVPTAKIKTKGEASDAMTAAKAMKQLRTIERDVAGLTATPPTGATTWTP